MFFRKEWVTSIEDHLLPKVVKLMFLNCFPVLQADKKLFTPGPLGVSLTTKQAMLRDLGSRDVEFIDTVQYLRQKLLDLAGKWHQFFSNVQGSFLWH